MSLRHFQKGFGKFARLFSSESLKIQTIVSGDGKTFPALGDYVEVHYEGKLSNGKLFDSSRARNESFSFRLGDGQVIAGWEQGIAKLSLGESATVVIPPELGYGDQEIPNVIPAASTLHFTVELLNIYKPVKPVVFKKPEHVHGPNCSH